MRESPATRRTGVFTRRERGERFLARGQSAAFPDFAALSASLFGGGHLSAQSDLTGEDTGLLIAVDDAEGREHIGPRCNQTHIVAKEVAAGLRRFQDVEGMLGQAQLDAPVGRDSTIKLARVAD